MDIFEIVDRFDTLCPPEEKRALLYYLQKGDEEHALSFLDRVGMLDRAGSRDGLFAALRTGSPELFRRLLAHVPRGEYADGLSEYELTGTMPTLAAALGKVEHLRLLLDWGCDVNGASLDAASAIADCCSQQSDEYDMSMRLCGVPTTDCTGLWENTVISGVTPLAAALLSGSVECVRLLLEREGVWLTETPGVSEALALRSAASDTAARRECRRLIRTRPDGTLRPLLLWAAIRHMDAVALRDELCRCEHGREEAVQAALVLAESDVPLAKKWEMFSVLGGCFPDVLQDKRVARKLTALIYQDFDGRYEPLPEVADKALGDTVDLDDTRIGYANYSAPLMERCLGRFGKGRKLVMSRDGISGSVGCVTASYLRTLIKHVEFRPPSLPLGVSGLSDAILRTGDSRIVRVALDRGLIPAEEPIERLLALAGSNTSVRSLLLTRPRRSVACAPEDGGEDSFRELTQDEQRRVLDEPALRTMVSDRLLHTLNNDMSLNEEEWVAACSVEASEPMALFAMRGETDAALRLARFCRSGTEWVGLAAVRLPENSAVEDMSLSALCCAALAGQTETVIALLDAGFDPEERDYGRPSGMLVHTGLLSMSLFSLSPLLCALLWERWDTAALLIERGAACDLTCYTVRRAFKALRGGYVPYGDIKRELGRYLEGRQLEKASMVNARA